MPTPKTSSKGASREEKKFLGVRTQNFSIHTAGKPQNYDAHQNYSTFLNK
jgi:hypothetical protein